MTDQLPPEVREALDVDARVDDVRRARMWARIDRALSTAPAPRSRRRWWLASAVAVAVAGVAVAWITRRPVATPAAVATPQVLELPAGGVVHTELSPAAHATLHGPARMVVRGAGADVTVDLDRGRLDGDYDHRAGGRWRIVTPHAVVTVVGTVFAIEVGAATCVSVEHGRVQVARGAVDRPIDRGQRWCSDTGAITGLPTTVGARLAAAVEPGPPTTSVPAPPVAPDARIPAAPRSAPAAPTTAGAIAAPPRTAEPVDAPVAPLAVDPVDAGVPPAATSDHDLYAAAERALGFGDTSLADALLARLIREHPASPLLDEALYERARLAFADGAWAEARQHVDQLLARPSTPLTSAAAFLRCRIAVRTADRDAGPCLDDLRTTAADATLALDALELRVQVAYRAGACRGAAPFIAELSRAAPRRPSTRVWRDRCPEAP